MSDVVVPGSRLCVNFSLSLEDGTIVDASAADEPWCLRLGEGALVEGLENVLLGLRIGERKTFVLPPQEAFGVKDEQAIQYLPRGDFPSDMPLERGAVVGFNLPTGEEIPGVILEVLDDRVLVDLNHPLASHTIIFDVQVVSIA